MRMHIRKIAKIAEAKMWPICQKFMSKRKLVKYNFANKVVEWYAKKWFCWQQKPVEHW